jgi:hypothetical protein
MCNTTCIPVLRNERVICILHSMGYTLQFHQALPTFIVTFLIYIYIFLVFIRRNKTKRHDNLTGFDRFRFLRLSKLPKTVLCYKCMDLQPNNIFYFHGSKHGHLGQYFNLPKILSTEITL